MAKLALLALAFLLAACAAQGSRREPENPQNCSGAYVILPGNFIIDMMAGSQVWLNPGMWAFSLFCEPDDARKALDLETGKLHEGSEWRIYRLDGAFSDLAESDSAGRFRLGKDALVIDWIEN